MLLLFLIFLEKFKEIILQLNGIKFVRVQLEYSHYSNVKTVYVLPRPLEYCWLPFEDQRFSRWSANRHLYYSMIILKMEPLDFKMVFLHFFLTLNIVHMIISKMLASGLQLLWFLLFICSINVIIHKNCLYNLSVRITIPVTQITQTHSYIQYLYEFG